MDANQIYTLARAAGFTVFTAVTATAIALAESAGNPAALGDTTITTATYGPSVGLMQIRSVKSQTGTGKSRDINRLTDPIFNMRAAYSISLGGVNFTPWSTYTNGRYKQFLATAQGARLSQDPLLSKALTEGKSWTNILIDAGITAAGGPIVGGAIVDGSHAVADAVASGASSPLAVAQNFLALLGKAGAWTADSHNWARVALVVSGSAGVLIGLAMLAKAGAGPVSSIAAAPVKAAKAAANVVPVARVAKVAGTAAKAAKAVKK